MQFWPPDDEHMCSKHVQTWNKLIVKQKLCASSWLITEINNKYVLIHVHILYITDDFYEMFKLMFCSDLRYFNNFYNRMYDPEDSD